MAVEVAQWLDAREERAREVGQRARTVADMAEWQQRLVRAVRETLRAHQPGEDGKCRDCGQVWPCHTQRIIGIELGASFPPPGLAGKPVPSEEASGP